MHIPSSDVRHFECTNSVQYQDLFSTLGDILMIFPQINKRVFFIQIKNNLEIYCIY
jgi:hypothetical protein